MTVSHSFSLGAAYVCILMRQFTLSVGTQQLQSCEVRSGIPQLHAGYVHNVHALTETTCLEAVHSWPPVGGFHPLFQSQLNPLGLSFKCDVSVFLVRGFLATIVFISKVIDPKSPKSYIAFNNEQHWDGKNLTLIISSKSCSLVVLQIFGWNWKTMRR